MRRRLLFLSLELGALAVLALVYRLSGALTSWSPVALLTVAWTGTLIITLALLVRDAAFFVCEAERKSRVGSKFVLLLLSAVGTWLLLEAVLTVVSRASRDPAGALAHADAMPEAWRKRWVHVPGAAVAWWWHGHLHVQDAHGFRRTEPFPPRREGVTRIIALGDSLTYGEGVAEASTWPAVLQVALAAVMTNEVLNLGVRGHESENVAATAEKFLPALRPDLVLYGVCLNDFLPAGVGQYESNNRWRLPMPESWKHFLIERARSIRLLSAAYNNVLMKLGIRRDFFDDIIHDLDNRQARFRRDLERINAAALAASGRPVTVMALDQYPKKDGRGQRIARIAEAAAAAAGAVVIPSEPFYEQHDGRAFPVSAWEGHPNEECQRIFAERFAEWVTSNIPRGAQPSQM